MGKDNSKVEDVHRWIEGEIAVDAFKDVRLGRRFKSLLEQLAAGTGESIPLACQDWANTKTGPIQRQPTVFCPTAMSVKPIF
ncbi:MAG: hypothetical protein JKY34_03325 [Kordiimonadaceae bacterium]|nr:hypothetical protein [Kordiimonadaceae bacterium]